jgi:hypothetical protein
MGLTAHIVSSNESGKQRMDILLELPTNQASANEYSFESSKQRMDTTE